MSFAQEREVYLLGPPVQSEAHIGDVTKTVLKKLSGFADECFEVSRIAGPLSFKTNYLSRGGDTVRLERPGMNYMQIWRCRVRLVHTPLPFDSFTVKVDDGPFHASDPNTRRGRSPHFETFLVTSPLSGKVPHDRVYVWRTRGKSWWFDRGGFIPDNLNRQPDDVNMRQTLAVLRGSEWSEIWSLHDLIPSPPGTSRRKVTTLPNRDTAAATGSTESFRGVSERMYGDAIFPKGWTSF